MTLLGVATVPDMSLAPMFPTLKQWTLWKLNSCLQQLVYPVTPLKQRPRARRLTKARLNLVGCGLMLLTGMHLVRKVLFPGLWLEMRQST